MPAKPKKTRVSSHTWLVRALSIFVALLIVGSTLAALFYL